MSLNSNLKKFRKNKGLTQKELAEKSGITRESIGNYERGDRIPPANILSKIAIALGVSINDLIDYDIYVDKILDAYDSQVSNLFDDFILKIEEEILLQAKHNKVENISEDGILNKDISIVFTNKSFKKILLDLIPKETFQKEFHLDTLELTDLEKESIVNDIYQYTQFICSKVSNSKKITTKGSD